MKRIKEFILAIVMLGSVGGSLLAPATVLADDPKADACNAIGANADCSGGTGLSVDGVVKSVVKILSIIIGIAAVFMIIISGLKYVTSNGDASAVSSAKSSLIYALIGLVIAASAYIIVGYVITNVK